MKLPYFKWYPADAETDAEYAAMSDVERGLYHHALNVSWINRGLPVDLDERSRVLARPKKYIEKHWPRIGRKFQEAGGVLTNGRQEEERSKAILKSERATDAVRTRYERSTNVVPRALTRADCDSDFDSFLNSKSREEKPIRTGAVAQSFAAFWARWCELTKRKQRESFACQAWVSVVEFETQVDAMACLERYGVSDEVRRGIVKNPDNWIYEQARDGFTGEWQPRDPTPPPNGNGQQSRIKRALVEAIADAERREKNGETDGAGSGEITWAIVTNGAIPGRWRGVARSGADAHAGCARCGVGRSGHRRAA